MNIRKRLDTPETQELIGRIASVEGTIETHTAKISDLHAQVSILRTDLNEMKYKLRMKLDLPGDD